MTKVSFGIPEKGNFVCIRAEILLKVLISMRHQINLSYKMSHHDTISPSREQLRACSVILSDHFVKAISVTTALFYHTVIMNNFQKIQLLFIHKIHPLHSLSSYCHVKNMHVFVSHNLARFLCTFHQILY